MDFVPLLALGTLVFSLIELAKDVQNRSWNGVVTRIVSWAVGVLVVYFVAQTVWAESIAVGELMLSDLDTPSLIFLGLVAPSILSTTLDISRVLSPTEAEHDRKLTNLRSSSG